MPTKIYSLNSAKANSPITPSELVSSYFFGIPIVDQSGSVMSDEAIMFHINAAVEELEGYLNMKFTKQIVRENLHYNLNDFKAWGYLPTSFPVKSIVSLRGFLGKIQQIEYPTEWLSIKESTDNSAPHRAVYMVPSSGSAQTESVAYSGIVPHTGWFAQGSIPNYWTVEYCTSFDRIPEDLMTAIGKMAAIGIYHQLGDIILGAGIASQSIGIDGLSQSIATTSSATNAGYGARVGGYLDDIKSSLPKLKQKYDGMILMSC